MGYPKCWNPSYFQTRLKNDINWPCWNPWHLSYALHCILHLAVRFCDFYQCLFRVTTAIGLPGLCSFSIHVYSVLKCLIDLVIAAYETSVFPCTSQKSRFMSFAHIFIYIYVYNELVYTSEFEFWNLNLSRGRFQTTFKTVCTSVYVQCTLISTFI